ncbi:MAG: hypothetical protein H6745_13165 [Deltaproteobacteria bacterium]|nr:hypothetical protein [Deltaproteobacteria bacterium]
MDDDHDGPRPERRRQRGLEALGGLLRGRFRGRRLPWERVVGAALAEVSVCVGVDGGGRLRVVAKNEATRREIAAREDHVLAIYNVEAHQLGRAPASSLLCFVGDGRSFRPREPRERALHSPVASPGAVGRAPAPPDPEARADVAALGLGVPDATKDALARVLAGRRARARADKLRDSDAQG